MVGDTGQPKQFYFLPAYADLIAHGINKWAYIEYYVSSSIWALAEVSPAIGACMTSQMFTLNAKLSCLLALLKARKADDLLIKKVNKFSDGARDALDARNRIAHDMWFNDNYMPNQMGKLRVTADKVLRFHVDSIPIEQLQADVDTIERRRTQIGEIRNEIKTALPTLPKMSHVELYPILENPVDLQNPTTGRT